MTTWAALTPADYVILGLVILAFLDGCRRGLLAEVIRFGAFVVAFLVAGRYSAPFRLWMNEHWQLEDRLARFLALRLGLPAEAYQSAVPASTLQAADWLQGFPLPSSYREHLIQQLVEWQPDQAVASPARFLLQQLAQTLAAALSYLILLALTGLVVSVVARLLSMLLAGDPFLNAINRVAGGALRAVEATVLVALTVALVVPALSVVGIPWLQEQMSGAVLAPYCLSLFDWLQTAVSDLAGGLLPAV